MDTFTVRSGDVRIPVTVAGNGPRAMFVPGMSITQAGLGELIGELRRFLQLATFDLRGHGHSDAADDYGYGAFAADATAVTDAVTRAGPVIMLGFSLGGDLALDQAAARPETPAVFLLDGGTPMTEPFLNDAELADMHDTIRDNPPEQYDLTADEHVAALREIDVHRRSTTARFDALACPVTMIMSTTLAGTDGARARELNDAWRHGVDDLVATRPAIEVHRLPGGHDMPLVHPRTVAEIVRERVERL